MYKKFLQRYKKYKRLKAMMHAIELAQTSVYDFDKKSSKADGLRVIRRFERLNNITFGPFNNDHLELINGGGIHEEFFRNVKRVFNTP